MIRHFADNLARIPNISIINILVEKNNKPNNYEVFENAWGYLIQRFENTISHRNFTGPANPDDRGMIFCDHTEDKKLMGILRQRRRYNPIPHTPTYAQQFGSGYYNSPIEYIIEDPSFRDSRHSYFIQAVDMAAYLLYQNAAPCAYIRKKSAQNYLNRLQPVLCKVASRNDPNGIVRL